MIYVYGVRARKETRVDSEGNANPYSSTQAVRKYLVPWMGEVFANVQTDGGNAVGVEGVTLSMCHFDGSVVGRCREAETDVFGQAKFAMLVSVSRLQVQ
jgi:hypothetical protein